jgi:hypothetical protein
MAIALPQHNAPVEKMRHYRGAAIEAWHVLCQLSDLS